MHNGVKLHCYIEDTQLYIHLSHENTAAAFQKLNECLHDGKNVKEYSQRSLISAYSK